LDKIIKENIVLIGIKEYFLIAFGIFLYVFGCIAFIIPNGIGSGGVTGMSLIISYATNGGIPVYLSYLVLNVLLLVIGILILGHGFGIKTLFAIGIATLSFKLLPLFITWQTTISNPAINAIIGGAFCAIGISIVFSQGGSTGGTDVLALIANKFYDISLGRFYMISDMIIVSSILFVPNKTLSDAVYGYIVLITFSLTIDYIMTGTKQSIQMLIFTQKPKEIRDEMITKMNRGVTSIEAKGGYSNEDLKILIIVARKQQLTELTREIKKIDSKAFITVTPTTSVYGRGFDQIKEGKITWKKKSKEK